MQQVDITIGQVTFSAVLDRELVLLRVANLLAGGGGHRRRATILAPVSFPAPHRRSGTAPRTRSPNRSLPSPGPAARCWPQSATGAPFYFVSNACRCLNGHWPDFQGSEHSLHCLGQHAAAARSFFSPGAADFKSGPNPGPLTDRRPGCLLFNFYVYKVTPA